MKQVILRDLGKKSIKAIDIRCIPDNLKTSDTTLGSVEIKSLNIISKGQS